MNGNQVLKYNADYKTLYVSQGSCFEFEGLYKVEKTKVTFKGKLLYTDQIITDKKTSELISLPIKDVVTFDLFLEETKLTIKDKEYTFKPFDSFLLLYSYLNYHEITNDVPFKGVLDFGLNPNYLEMLGTGVDDFGNKVSKESIYGLIHNKCACEKVDKLSFDVSNNSESKYQQKSSYSEYQRLSDRYKFLAEKLGIENDVPTLKEFCQCLGDLIESYGDTVDVNQLLAILVSK